MGIGINVRRIRRGAGVTQARLAEMVGVTQPAIAMIEIGYTKSVSIDMASKIADALGVSLDELTREVPNAEPS